MNKIDSLCPYGAYILAGDTNFTQQFSYSCEKAMAPHSSTLAWKIPRMEKPSGLQSMGLLRVGHDWATSLSFSLSCIGEGNGNPLQCSCLENPRDEGACWAAIYVVPQSETWLKQLSSSSSIGMIYKKYIYQSWLILDENIIAKLICIFIKKSYECKSKLEGKLSF